MPGVGKRLFRGDLCRTIARETPASDLPRKSFCRTAIFLCHPPSRSEQPSTDPQASKVRLSISVESESGRYVEMLWTIFVILLVLWLLGVVSSYTLGGFIHILLVIALVVLLIQLISGRRPVV